MAKKVTGIVRLQVPAGKANPAPPIGPALGAQGVNIMAFCKQFNAATADKDGLDIPVVITVYADKSFTFILKSPPAAVLLKKAAGLQKGSGTPNKTKVGRRPQRHRPRARRPHDRGHRPLDGHHRRQVGGPPT